MVPLTEEEKANRPFTVQEAAEYLQVRQETILRWIYDKKIKAGKVGGTWRIKRSEIDRLIEGE